MSQSKILSIPSGSKGRCHGRRVCTCKAGPSRVPRCDVVPSKSVEVRVLRRGVESPVEMEKQRFIAGQTGPCTTGSQLWGAGRGRRRAGPLKGRAEVVKVIAGGDSDVVVMHGSGRGAAVTVAKSVRVKPGRAVRRGVAQGRVTGMPSEFCVGRDGSGLGGVPRDGPGGCAAGSRPSWMR